MSRHRKHKADISNENNNVDLLKTMGYTIRERIGEGTYSKVCVAIYNNGNNVQKKYACKIIDKKRAGGEFIKRFLPRELKIVALIDHPNIVTVSNILEIKTTIYMFMDYCSNGDLLDYIRNNGPMSEIKAKHFFKQLVNAVAYLHKRHLAHRDLKCENIFLTESNSLKIGDFGFARSCKYEGSTADVLSSTFCGSAAYAAPEILQGIPYNPKMYDVWSLGCILYIMLTATMPFDDTNITKMLKCQLNRAIRSHNYFMWKLSSNSLLSLIGSLLEPNAKKRATIADVLNCQWLREAVTFRKFKHYPIKKEYVCN